MSNQLALIPGESSYERRLHEVYHAIRTNYPAACAMTQRYINDPAPTRCSAEFWQEVAEALTKSTWKPKRMLLIRIAELSFQAAKERRNAYETAA